MDYKNLYHKYKHKYLKLKYGGNTMHEYTDKEKEFIDNNICCLVHETTPTNFKKKL